jgi:hypothetical protein
MERLVARILTYIFHPFFLPVYMLLVLMNLNAYFSLMISFRGKILLLLMAVLNTIIIPGIMILLYKKLGLVRQIQMDSREERQLPLFTSSLMFLVTAVLFQKTQVHPVFALFFLGGAFTSALAMLVNRFWKISLHMISLGGASGALSGISVSLGLDLLYWIAGVVLVAGFTGFARIKLKAHNLAQLGAGFAMGFSIMFLVYLIY